MNIKLPFVLRSRLDHVKSALRNRDETISLLVREQTQVREEFVAITLAKESEIFRLNEQITQLQDDRAAQAKRIVLLEQSLEKASVNDIRDPLTGRFVSASEAELRKSTQTGDQDGDQNPDKARRTKETEGGEIENSQEAGQQKGG